MSASTADRNTDRRSGEELSLPVAASTLLYAGILAALNSGGFVVAAADTAGLRVIGRTEERVDNAAGANGALAVQVRRGVFLFDNSTTAALDKDDIGKQCFVEDDHTVAETSTHGVKAGRFLGFNDGDETQCWVETPGSLGSLGKFTQTSAAIALADATDDATVWALANALKVEHNKVVADITALKSALT